MTNRETSFPQDHNDGARIPRPASRLRRALDIARRATAVEPDDEDSPSAEDDRIETLEPVAAGAVPRRDSPARLRALESALDGEHQERVGRRRAGRGLDALIPAEPVGPVSVEDAWASEAQGWVRSDTGNLRWRPIVTTTPSLDEWIVATYLGVVSGRALIETSDPDANALARGERDAVDRMVAAAVGRGAHGVIGTSLDVARTGSGYLISATGTAVTLAARR